MEVLEFIKQKERMCDYHCGKACTNDDSGEICPAYNINCDTMTDQPEQLVAIVEKWAKEHPEKPERERQKPEQERHKPEYPEESADVTKPKQDETCLKTIQDNLEGAIYRSIASNKERIENLEYDVSVIRHNLSVLHDTTYALSEKVDHTPTEEPNQTPEQRRTNKDVLLAAFPNARMDDNGIPDVCPLALDAQYDCKKFAKCSGCKCAHWLAESEEK